MNFRAEAFTGSTDEAHRLTEQLGTFLQLFHTAEGTVSVPNSDADMKAFFNNLKIEQKRRPRRTDRSYSAWIYPQGNRITGAGASSKQK